QLLGIHRVRALEIAKQVIAPVAESLKRTHRLGEARQRLASLARLARRSQASRFVAQAFNGPALFLGLPDQSLLLSSAQAKHQAQVTHADVFPRWLQVEVPAHLVDRSAAIQRLRAHAPVE